MSEPKSPMDRAMERITDETPVEILRPPTTGRIVRGKRGKTPPPRTDQPTRGRAVSHPDEDQGDT